jgi:5S rRNA maturation endonuclease (ribonuclease M5)
MEVLKLFQDWDERGQEYRDKLTNMISEVEDLLEKKKQLEETQIDSEDVLNILNLDDEDAKNELEKERERITQELYRIMMID